MHRAALGLFIVLLSGAGEARSEVGEVPLSTAARATQVVDVSLHRRAADVLEEGRDRLDSPWADARLSSEVVAFHRLGFDGAAYYEFGVEGSDGEPRGFMILSTGPHDAPVVHASMHGERPSARLLAKAGANTPARLYRLGQTFVAEDARGGLVAQLGDLPGKMVGYDARWLDVDAQDRYGYGVFDGETYDEHLPTVGQGLNFVPWSSWAELREGYAKNRAPLHPRDAAAAADDWEADTELADNGETLQTGHFRELPLLDRGGARYEVRGEGARFVKVEQTERPLENDEALRVFVHEMPEGEVFPVDIDVSYGDGTAETLRLNVTASLAALDGSAAAGEPAADRGDLPTSVLGAPVKVRRPGDPLVPTAGPSRARVGVRVKVVALGGLTCKKVALGAPHSHYLSQQGTDVRADAMRVGNSELFAVTHMGGGRVNFRAANGRWLRAVGKGGAEVRADQQIGPADESIFRVYDNGRSGSSYGFQAPDRRHHLSAGGRMLRADLLKSQDSDIRLAWCEPQRLQSKWAGRNFSDVWQKVRKYDQLPAHKAPSTSQCASGCGATAWAMLFGFHDYQASQSGSGWEQHWGLYRRGGSKDGPDEVAPEWFWPTAQNRLWGPGDRSDKDPHEGIAKVVWEISQQMNDWTLAGCAPNGSKWTAPVIMGRAHKYLEDRTDGVSLISNYDGAMIFTHEGKTRARRVISDRRPVVLGIRDPEHYPLGIGWEATKYRVWDRGAKKWSDKVTRSHFVVHMGHQQEHPDNVPYDSWFQGALSLGAHSADDSVARAKPTEDPVVEESSDKTPTQKLPTTKHQPIPNPTAPNVPTPIPNW